MRHAFNTDRLRVMVVRFDPGGGNMMRDLYIALITSEEQVYPVAYATVADMRTWGPGAKGMIGYFGTPIVLDMIEVNDLYRRQGIATELMRGLEAHIGFPLHADGVSESGDALLQSLES